MSSICSYPSQGILLVDELANFKGMRSIDIKPIKVYGGEDTGVCLKAELDVPNQMAKMWRHCTLDNGEIKYPESVVRNTCGAYTHHHSHTHAHMHTHTHTHARIHTHTHHTTHHHHLLMHTHAHTHTHTHTHTEECMYSPAHMHTGTTPNTNTTHITQEHIHMHTYIDNA